MSLREYTRKRRFDRTPEPAAGGRAGRGRRAPVFVVQLHHARARHYDFRLEADGVLKSWAVPKGPSLRPGEQRLAVAVEDHPLAYAGFAGDIPEGHYGAGHVDIFDHGTWAPDGGDPLAAIAAGKLDFELHGAHLRGRWTLVRTHRAASRQPWLLIKRSDAEARDAEADDFLDRAQRETSARWLREHGQAARAKAIAGAAPASHESAGNKPAQRAAAQRKPARSESVGRKAVQGGTSRHEAVGDEAAQRGAIRGETARRGTVRRERATRRPRARDAEWRKRARALDGARDAPLPEGFPVQLTMRKDRPPAGDGWLHETKWDGYRLLADLVGGRARLRSRNGLDWTARAPAIARAVEALPVRQAGLDGELVALDAHGDSSFSALLDALENGRQARLRYVLFDLPGVAGVDLRETPLRQRKDLLEVLLADAPPVLVYSSHVRGHGAQVYAAAVRRGLEGVVSKRADSTYHGGRSPDWIKVRHAQTDDFVVVGFTQPKGARAGFGSLLLATREGGELRYVGRVGTGFDEAQLHALAARLRERTVANPVLELPAHVPLPARRITWVEPRVLVEVAFRGWARQGLLRQGSFLRVREDKNVEDLDVGIASVPRERTAASAGAGTGRSGKAAKSGEAGTSGKAAGSGKAGRSSKAGGSDSTGESGKAAGSGKAGKSSKAARSDNALPGAPRRTEAATEVAISHASRQVYPDAHITKGDVTAYYAAVADWILPGLVDRPLSLLRCPGGVGRECFFQKHHAATLGGSVRAIALKEKEGGVDDYVYVRDLKGLLELVQMNTLEFHPWGARVDRPDAPDRLVLDLDPAPGIAWKAVVAAAREMRGRLEEVGLASFVRTSGGKGLHVVAPFRRGPDWQALKDFCESFAEAMVASHPMRYVATASKARREGRIFIDWLRNARGATSVCGWSLRAREGAPVAMPLRWEELARTGGGAAYDLRSALRRARGLKADPWEGMATLRQRLPRL